MSVLSNESHDGPRRRGATGPLQVGRAGPGQPSPPALGRVEIHDVESETVGDRLRVFVGHCGENPRAVLLVTDANGLFGLAVDTVRLMQLPALLAPLLVVGIGYPHTPTLGDSREVRVRDLTPTPRAAYTRSGGADSFLGFIRDELLPWLDRSHPGSCRDVTFFGHSLGGLFGTHVLLSAPEAFQHYIISSPSLWWDDGLMLRRAEQWASGHDDLPADVFFGIGRNETDPGRRREAANLPADDPAKPPETPLDMVEDLHRFVEHLHRGRYPRLAMRVTVFDDEYHATVPARALTRGLRHVHRSP